MESKELEALRKKVQTELGYVYFNAQDGVNETITVEGKTNVIVSAINTYVTAEVKEAEDKILKIADTRCTRCEAALRTPVRSVTGAMVSYCTNCDVSAVQEKK